LQITDVLTMIKKIANSLGRYFFVCHGLNKKLTDHQ